MKEVQGPQKPGANEKYYNQFSHRGPMCPLYTSIWSEFACQANQHPKSTREEKPTILWLRFLRFMLCSRDLDVLRTWAKAHRLNYPQIILITHNWTRSENAISWTVFCKRLEVFFQWKVVEVTQWITWCGSVCAVNSQQKTTHIKRSEIVTCASSVWSFPMNCIIRSFVASFCLRQVNHWSGCTKGCTRQYTKLVLADCVLWIPSRDRRA